MTSGSRMLMICASDRASWRQIQLERACTRSESVAAAIVARLSRPHPTTRCASRPDRDRTRTSRHNSRDRNSTADPPTDCSSSTATSRAQIRQRRVTPFTGDSVRPVRRAARRQRCRRRRRFRESRRTTYARSGALHHRPIPTTQSNPHRSQCERARRAVRSDRRSNGRPFSQVELQFFISPVDGSTAPGVPTPTATSAPARFDRALQPASQRRAPWPRSRIAASPRRSRASMAPSSSISIASIFVPPRSTPMRDTRLLP